MEPSKLQVSTTDLLCQNKANRPGRHIKPEWVVFHWTANEGKGADALANARYFQRATVAASAHYCVDDIRVVRCIPDDEMAYHVGAKKYTPWCIEHIGKSPNAKTIGIEMCVNQGASFWQMYSNAVRLTADLLNKYNLPTDRVIRHYDVTGKLCPAFMVSDAKAKQYMARTAKEAWATFLKDVNRIRKG